MLRLIQSGGRNMNEYLIEWLNMKIDESLHKGNYTDFDNYVKLKEMVEER